MRKPIMMVKRLDYTPTRNIYRLDELLGKNNDFFENNRDGYLFIPNLEFIKENFDEFLYIISKEKFNIIYTLDYSVLKFLETNMPRNADISCYLVDDGENKNRSYIDLDYFDKLDVAISIIYTTWNIKAQKDIKVAGVGPHYDNPN